MTFRADFGTSLLLRACLIMEKLFEAGTLFPKKDCVVVMFNVGPESIFLIVSAESSSNNSATEGWLSHTDLIVAEYPF
jgi:hypothetical protein